jgi:hypothetical protein
MPPRRSIVLAKEAHTIHNLYSKTQVASFYDPRTNNGKLLKQKMELILEEMGGPEKMTPMMWSLYDGLKRLYIVEFMIDAWFCSNGFEDIIPVKTGKVPEILSRLLRQNQKEIRLTIKQIMEMMEARKDKGIRRKRLHEDPDDIKRIKEEMKNG